MEYLYIIGGLAIALFILNFIVDIAVSIILSALIIGVASMVVFSEYGMAVMSGEASLAEKPLLAVSLGVSAIALVLLWFFEGLNLLVLLLVWAVANIPAYQHIKEHNAFIRDLLNEEKEESREPAPISS